MTGATLKVGCIGTGVHFYRHGIGWSACDKAELVALSDTDAETLRAQGAEYGVPRLYENPVDLIADDDLDVVDVVVPNSFHADLVVAALERGKHVVCEKPLATSVAEVERIIEARDKAKRLVMTAQNYRFSTVAQEMKALVESDRLGDIYHARCWYLRRHGLPVSPGRLYKRIGGGGACSDIGIHVLDLSLWLMGHPAPMAVSGTASAILARQPGALGRDAVPIPADMDVEEFAAGFVRFANGATLVFETSWLLHQGPDVDKQIWLYGSKGGASFPEGAVHHTDLEEQRLLSTQIAPMHKLRGEYDQESYSAQFAAFAEAVTTGGVSPVPPEQSLHAQMIIEGIYRSQTTGAEVRLD